MGKCRSVDNNGGDAFGSTEGGGKSHLRQNGFDFRSDENVFDKRGDDGTFANTFIAADADSDCGWVDC